MREFLQFAVLGLGAGAAYALLGQGIVLIYRGSGVVNFAHGAVAALASYFAFATLNAHGWPLWLSIVGGILIAAAAAYLFQALILVRLRNAAPIVRLIATLGFLAVVEGGLNKAYGTEYGGVIPSFLPTGTFKIGSVLIEDQQIVLLGIAVAVTAVLWAFSRYTRLGLAIAAGAESPLGVAAVGWSARRLAAFTWVVGGTLAGVAGILLAPLVGLDVDTLVLAVTVYALAAALLGGFDSFPLTLIGALLLGIGQSLLTFYTPNIQKLFGVATLTGLGEALPFLVIVIVLAVRGSSLPVRGESTDWLPSLGSGEIRWSWLAVGTGTVGALCLFVFNVDWQTAIAVTETAAIFLLSIVVLTGMTGQLSLAQYAIGGIGAFVAAKLVSQAGFPFELAFLAGVVITVPIGCLFALAALRTRGVNLAVVTLGLGFAVQQVVFSNPVWTGATLSGGTAVGPVKIFGLAVDSLNHPGRWAVLCLIAFVLVVVVVANLRRSASGRRLIAVRANERAAASLGISVFAAKIYAFAIASAVAALGGILLGFANPVVTYDGFDPISSINAVGQAVIGGLGWASGALYGATLASGSVGSIPLSQWLQVSGAWLPIIGGVSLIVLLLTYPNGIADAGSRDLGRIRARLKRRAETKAKVSVKLPETVSPPRVTPMALEVSGLTVGYGAVTALSDVSLTVTPGQIVGLIGPNGAGKTTLIDAVSGFVRPREGELVLGGRSIGRTSASSRARAGLRRSFQSEELFEDVSVFENLLVAADRATPLSWLADLVWPGRKELLPAAVAAVKRFELEDALGRKPAELPHGRRRLVGLARAMASGPSVLLLDEPAAGLDSTESQQLGKLISELASVEGMAVLLIEHDVDLVMAVCDHVVVLDFGRVIASGPPDRIRDDPAVVAAYLGQPVVMT